MEILINKNRTNLFTAITVLLTLSFLLLFSSSCSNEEFTEEVDAEVLGGGNTNNGTTSEDESENGDTEEEGTTNNDDSNGSDGEEEDEEETGVATKPSDILEELKEWKLTLPVDRSGNDSTTDAELGTGCVDRNNNAHEIIDVTGVIPNPYAEYFYVDGEEVIFKAHCGGATTNGSSYPRSGLRQTPGGPSNYWLMQDYQFLDVRVRVLSVPVNKPEVSMVQIQGPNAEPLRVEYRLDDLGLHVTQNKNVTRQYVLPYELGEQLRIIAIVDDGDITVRIENESRPELDFWEETWAANSETGYFRVGCYTQSSMFLSSCKGTSYDNELPDSYGSVAIRDLNLISNY